MPVESVHRARASLSPSVQRAVDELGVRRPVTAGDVVRQLLTIHPEYARGEGRRLAELIGPTEEVRPAMDWVDAIRSLLADGVDVLHGRLVILGLTLLAPDLAKQLRAEGALDLLQQELREPVESLLPGFSAQTVPAPLDAVKFHSDNPAYEDRLSRRPFAGYLAARLRYLRAEEIGSFFIHLDGPWGAGKTSLLNFLRDELHREHPQLTGIGESRRWNVFEFNAWRHQRLDPPWWMFLDSVTGEVPRELWRGKRHADAIRFWVLDRLWRTWISLGNVLITAVLLAVLVWLLFGRLELELFGISSDVLRDVGLFTTLAGVAYAVGQRLMPSSHRALHAMIQSSRDPLDAVRGHFEKVAKRADPLAVFIDDLDRCQETYVVHLLEGIQTLFRDAKVAYVVASDRRWIEESYEVAYERLASTVAEPGRSLGYLFLHKAFQVSASLPPVAPRLAEEFWGELLERGSGTADSTDELSVLRSARDRFAGLSSTAEIEDALADAGGDTVRYGLYAQAALERLAAPDMRAKTEHALLPLATLVESNPRAMKRLVNAYDVQRAILTLRRADVGSLDQLPLRLGLWTVVLLRWPALAAWLQARPEAVSAILGQAPAPGSLPDDPKVRELFDDPDVRRVVRAEKIGISLDESTIRAIAGIHPMEARPVVA